jgi:hypothetical protein
MAVSIAIVCFKMGFHKCGKGFFRKDLQNIRPVSRNRYLFILYRYLWEISHGLQMLLDKNRIVFYH